MTRVQHDTHAIATNFQEAIPQHIHEQIEEVEADIQLERTLNPTQEVNEGIIIWVPGIGSLCRHESKYLRTMELYSHLKILLGQMLQTREEAQNTIQIQQDEFHLLLCEVLVHLPSSISTTTMQPSRKCYTLFLSPWVK